jgi:hypothetical protein
MLRSGCAEGGSFALMASLEILFLISIPIIYNHDQLSRLPPYSIE